MDDKWSDLDALRFVVHFVGDIHQPLHAISDADAGGNCEATIPGQQTEVNGVTILGFRNWPGRIPVAASSLYAKNLLTFLTTFWDKEANAPKLPETDDIIKGVMLTRGGAVVHPSFLPSQAA